MCIYISIHTQSYVKLVNTNDSLKTNKQVSTEDIFYSNLQDLRDCYNLQDLQRKHRKKEHLTQGQSPEAAAAEGDTVPFYV